MPSGSKRYADLKLPVLTQMQTRGMTMNVLFSRGLLWFAALCAAKITTPVSAGGSSADGAPCSSDQGFYGHVVTKKDPKVRGKYSLYCVPDKKQPPKSLDRVDRKGDSRDQSSAHAGVPSER